MATREYQFGNRSEIDAFLQNNGGYTSSYGGFVVSHPSAISQTEELLPRWRSTFGEPIVRIASRIDNTLRIEADPKNENSFLATMLGSYPRIVREFRAHLRQKLDEQKIPYKETDWEALPVSCIA